MQSGLSGSYSWHMIGHTIPHGLQPLYGFSYSTHWKVCLLVGGSVFSCPSTAVVLIDSRTNIDRPNRLAVNASSYRETKLYYRPGVRRCLSVSKLGSLRALPMGYYGLRAHNCGLSRTRRERMLLPAATQSGGVVHEYDACPAHLSPAPIRSRLSAVASLPRDR
jgi:hypothetical protein